MIIDQIVKFGEKSGCRTMQETVAHAVSFMVDICDGRLENRYLMIPDFEDCVCTNLYKICFPLI